jgi:16S rRNA C967 or C1407 C5-methylase (RsmB/RsmF family)
MQVYMVERSLKGIAMEALAAAQQRAIATAQQFTKDGTPVRYIRTTFVPEEGCCMCLFAADKSEDVKRVNEVAQIPFDRIVPALDLTPQ